MSNNKIKGEVILRLSTKKPMFDSIERYNRVCAKLFAETYKDYEYKDKIGIVVWEDVNQYVQLPIAHLLSNLIFLYPWMYFNEPVQPSDWIDLRNISNKDTYHIYDNVISRFADRASEIDICKALQGMRERSSKFAHYFDLIQANSLDYQHFMELCYNDPKIMELVFTTYKEGIATDLIEKDITRRVNELVERIKMQSTNPIAVMLISGGMININQLAQFMICVGPRPNLYGDVLPLIVNANFLVGMNTLIDYHIESFAQRKSQEANNVSIRQSGYLSRKFDLSAVNDKLDHTIVDCGTVHHSPRLINDKEELGLYEFKNRVISRDANGKPTYAQIKLTDTHLIGQVIEVRDIAKCAAPTGKICATCYGGLTKFNFRYHTGLIATHSITAAISQIVLSTKHLLKTLTKVLVWTAQQKKYFSISGNAVFYKEQSKVKHNVVGFVEWDIIDYLRTEHKDEDMMTVSVTRVVVKNDVGELEMINLPIEVDLRPEFLEYLSKLKNRQYQEVAIYDEDVPNPDPMACNTHQPQINKQNVDYARCLIIPTAGYNKEVPIFTFLIANTEVSVCIDKILGLIDRTAGINRYQDIDQLFEVFRALIKRFKISPRNIAHLEHIIFNMVRDKDNSVLRPDFKKPDPQYDILHLSNAILKNKSVTTMLGFERLLSLLENPDIYGETYVGELDMFYV